MKNFKHTEIENSLMNLLPDSTITQILPHGFDLSLFLLQHFKAYLRHVIPLLNTSLHISKNVDILIELQFTYLKIIPGFI